MDTNKLPPLDNANRIGVVGPREPSQRKRFQYGLLGVAVLGALAGGGAIHNANSPTPDIQRDQAQVVAKFVMHDGVALQDRGPGAWQQAEEGLQARHNLVIELNGRHTVVSVSPEVFDSKCTHVTEQVATLWNGGMACGTVYGTDGEAMVKIDKLDKIQVNYSIDDADALIVHGLDDAKPAAEGFVDRLKLRHELKAKSSSKFSI